MGRDTGREDAKSNQRTLSSRATNLVTAGKIVWTKKFEREVRKLGDRSVKSRVRNVVQKIIEDPELGKPLRFELRGERSIRVLSYRLIYAVEANTLYLLRFEHRKTVYR